MREGTLEERGRVRYHERMDDFQTPRPPMPLPGTVQIPVRKPTDAPYAVIGLLSYISILCLVPLFICAPKSFEKFHALQGTMLFLSSIALGGISLMVPPAVGSVLISTTLVLSIVYVIIGTRNVMYGAREALPFFGRISTSLNFT